MSWYTLILQDTLHRSTSLCGASLERWTLDAEVLGSTPAFFMTIIFSPIIIEDGVFSLFS